MKDISDEKKRKNKLLDDLKETIRSGN